MATYKELVSKTHNTQSHLNIWYHYCLYR